MRPEDLAVADQVNAGLGRARAAGCEVLAIPRSRLSLLSHHRLLRAVLGVRFPPVAIDVEGWAFDLTGAVGPALERPRLFEIGLAGTAGRALHRALDVAGLRSLRGRGLPGIDDAVVQAVGDDLPPLSYLGEHWDAVVEVRVLAEHFESLDRQYPGSRFILTEADGVTGCDESCRHRDRVLEHFHDRPGDLLVLAARDQGGCAGLVDFAAAAGPAGPAGLAGPGAAVPATATSSLSPPRQFAR